MAPVSYKNFSEGAHQSQSLSLTQSQKDCISEQTKCIIFVVSAVAAILFTLSTIAVGGCTAAGCIHVKVGGGLIIGMSAVLICVALGGMKWIGENTGSMSFDPDALRKRRQFGCGMGVLLVANIIGVVIGALSVSSILSPMVGGILLTTVVPILLLSMSGFYVFSEVFCMSNSNVS